MFIEANQEVPVMVEDVRAAAQRIAANCRMGRPLDAFCPENCPGLVACSLAGWKSAREACCWKSPAN